MYAPPIFLGRHDLKNVQIQRSLAKHDSYTKELIFVFGDNVQFVHGIKLVKHDRRFGLVLFKGTGILADTALKIADGQEIGETSLDKGALNIQIFFQSVLFQIINLK